MRFLRKNFVFILLFLSSVAVGVLALVTALRLREFRSASTPTTSALTPPCSFTFTIEDTTPREKITPQTSPTEPITPTLFLPTSTPTPSPTKAVGGLQTLPTSTPTPLVLAQAPTNTPTPTLPAYSSTESATLTTTATSVPQPDLPISGISFPTVSTLLFGLVLLFLGVLAVI